MTRTLLLAGLACCLAACSPPASTNTGAAQGSAAAPASSANASAIQPGQYRTTLTILEMNIPGAPAQGLNMAPSTSEDCVTASDVADFTRKSMVEADAGETCTQNSMNSLGGRIDGQATCTGENGTRTMRMTGAYTSNHLEMEIASSSAMPGGRGNMTQRMRMVSDRIGECPAGADHD